MAEVECPQDVEMNQEEGEKEMYTPGPNAVDISPNQDKGVLKEIIKEGIGTETPRKGNKVFVHYTGKLLDGTVFDSSRDRDIFDFTLGKEHVIKAWDIGVATMKEGEMCILTCAPEYAYGKAGSPPKIPADATLVFEVELLRWELEELHLGKGGGVKRAIIEEGTGAETPNDDATVEVHLVGRCAGNIFEERDLKFQIGEGYEHGVVDGLEIALKNFKKGEKSRIVLSPKFAFGPAGKPEFNIPPDSEVEYEVTLKSFEKAKESWEMDADEKLEQSEIVKSRGTKYFNNGQYDKAVKQYKKIVNYLQYETGLEEGKAEKRNTLIVAGYLNLAACYLKLNENMKVLENTNKALEIEADNIKGLFRRGQARFNMKDFELAKSDFQKVVEKDANNKAAQKQIIICNENIRKQLEKEKMLYRNMFEKLAKYNEEKKEEPLKIGDVGDMNFKSEEVNSEPDSSTPEKMDIGDGSQTETAKA